jgi:succinylarginine dihydrolase
MSVSAREFNFDGIVGPTHNYAGLSHGNLASSKNKLSVSNPRAAALEGLAKMLTVQAMGVPQAVLPPHERPHVPTLRRLGFAGSDAQVVEQAYRHDPVLLAACSSASAMWTANAATVSPSADCADGRVHFTPANLGGLLHRSIETATTARVLKAIFADSSAFAHHDPLPTTAAMGDEGAANHSRFCSSHGDSGLEIFVYGRRGLGGADAGPRRFPGRQTLEASEAIARLHELRPERTVYLQQNPAAIDAGAFHNDVVAVGYRNVLFYHELAYAEPIEGMLDLFGHERHFIRVPAAAVPLEDAISSYLFNSQLVESDVGTITLIAPAECNQIPSVRDYLRSAAAWPAIKNVVFVDVRQSMRNGGGPACLRLRVVLTDGERAKVKANVLFDLLLFQRLAAWVQKHYREELKAADLADPKLLQEGRAALDELSGILGIGAVYDFQR